jgi:histidinol phosphatase-like PHP family hydrolase
LIDLHIHSLFSDGELLPSEIVRRAVTLGYQALAITDHLDSSNLDFVLPRTIKACEELSDSWKMKVIPGVEITHAHPGSIAKLAEESRRLGARIVIVHGETIVEPVSPGTNRAALTADVDILAHPGLITEEEVALARKNGIFLEITSRRGHSLTNGHVARLATKLGARLVINTDSHSPEDLIDIEMAKKIVRGAGLTEEEFEKMRQNSQEIVRRPHIPQQTTPKI